MTQEFGVDGIDFEYVDISLPDVLDHIDDVNTIVENRLPLPYVSVNGHPSSWGLDDAGEMFSRVKASLAKEKETSK